MFASKFKQFRQKPVSALFAGGRFAPLTCVLAIANPVCAQAQEAGSQNAPLQKVEITAPDTQSQRRQDSAGKIVIARSELLQFGEQSLAEALKRQPGISVVGTEIRMRGLGSGYTQIMINGEPVPPGFSIDSLSPELIERVEIYRSTTAEFSAQAIAGSINIILRKSVERSTTQLKISAQHGEAGLSPALSLDMADRNGKLSWSLNAALTQNRSGSQPVTTETVRDTQNALTGLRRFHEDIRFQTDKFSIAPRLSWKLDNGDQVAWQNLLEYSQNSMRGNNHEQTVLGQASDYPDNDYRSDANTRHLRSDLSWSHRFSPEIKLDSKVSGFYLRRDSDYFFDGYSRPAATSPSVRNVVSYAVDQNLSASGKLLMKLNEQHSFALGWDGGLVRRSEQRLQLDHAAGTGELSRLNEEYHADVRRLAVFAQDEWEISPALQAYLGLRWEGLSTAIRGLTMQPVDTRSSVFSPVTQWLWKLPGSEKDQLRLAVSRTYKAPTTRNLVPRRYTVNNANSPTNADFQGNPKLLPELAWGIDLAYEHYLSKDSVVSLSTYWKRVDNITTFQLFRQDGAWVSWPDNQGRALIAGVEMDARFPLKLWWPRAPAVDVRFNLARNWSRVDSVPGPDNRLVAQVPVTGNLSLDYQRNANHTLGMNLNLQTGGYVRTATWLNSYSSVNRGLDIYSLWKWEQGLQLRLSLLNVLHQPLVTAEGYTYQGNRLRSIETPRSTAIRLVLEKRL